MPCLYLLAAVASVALASSALSSFAFGQDDMRFVGSVEIVNAKATKLKTLKGPIGTTFNGVRGVTKAPEGKRFLVLNLELKPIFARAPDGTQRAFANWEVVTFGTNSDEPSWSIGTYDPHGRFSTGVTGYSFYDPNDARTGFADPVFLIPENATEGTLTFGGTKHAIKIPAATAEPFDPATAIELKIDSATAVTELSRKFRASFTEKADVQLTQQLETTAGRFALVTIVLKPKVRNALDGYYFELSEFGLLLGKEVYVVPIGYFEEDQFSDYASDLSFERDALGEYNAGSGTLVFPLPGAVTNGKLLYLGAAVADVSFGE